MTRQPLTLVAAVAADGTIGHEGSIPWHVPEDMRHFRAVTLGHAVIMGRKTFESLPGRRPLRDRRNIVVTRNPGLVAEGFEVAHSLDEAIALARATDDDPRIIGGETLYREAMPRATTLLLTRLWREWPCGDALFPEVEISDFRIVERRHGETVGVEFLRLVRAT